MMSRNRLLHALLVLTLSLCACPDHHPETQEAPAAAAATPDLQVTLLSESGGGMVPIPFVPGERSLIEPTQTLEVRPNLTLLNSRIRVFDEVDHAMISDDEVLEPPPALDGGPGTGLAGYRIHFPTPLKTGHRYSLVIDAQTGTTFSDSIGRSHPDWRLEFQIAGEKEKPAPVQKSKPRSKRRR